MAIIYGSEEWTTGPERTQVFQATHTGEGERLPLHNRSFISFMYGGKHIEDFGFIAVINGGRLQKLQYGSFDDLISEYDILDGQFYWGSRFKNNTFDIQLATDGVTEDQLSDFKNWFMPGKIRELVLAEYPNRAIWARVVAVPSFSLIPFEEEREIIINQNTYKTKMGLYKGEMTLSLVADEPFWHSRANKILTFYTDKNDKIGSMTDDYAEGAIATLSDKDFIKIIADDHVPHKNMIINDNSVIFFGDNNSTSGLSETQVPCLYYSGTAPSRPVISFTATPAFIGNYITFPFNSKSADEKTNIIALVANNDTRTIEEVAEENVNCLKFSLPSLLYGYNQAIDIIQKFKENDSILDVKNALRDGINEYYSRAWAVFCAEFMRYNQQRVDEQGALLNGFQTYFITLMKNFFTGTTPQGETVNIFPFSVKFNCKTGEAIGKFTVRVADAERMPVSEEQMKEMFGTEDVIENIGDMVVMNNFVIDQRCNFNEQGQVRENICLKIITNVPDDNILSNFSIQYENLYL